MKKPQRILPLFIAVVLLAVPLAGCGEPAGEDVSADGVSAAEAVAGDDLVTIRFVSQHTRSDASRAGVYDAIADYADSVSGRYTLEHEAIQNDEIKAKIKIDLAADNCPDVFYYWNAMSDVSAMLEADVLLPMNDYIAHPDAEIDWDMFMESSIFELQGERYGFAMENWVGAWFANKNLFQEYGLAYPETYDDIIDLAGTFRENGITTVATGSKGGNPGHWFIGDIYYQLQGAEEEMLALADTGVIATDTFLYALQYYERMRDAGCFPSDTISNGDWAPNFSYYNEGNAALITGYGWQLSAMSDACYEWTQIIPSPKMTGDNVIDATGHKVMTGGHGAIFISKDRWTEGNAKQAAIVDLMNFYFSDEMFAVRYRDGGYNPTKLIEDFDYSAGLPIIMDIMEFEEANNLTKVNQMHMLTIPNSTVWADYEGFLDEFFSGAISAEQYLEKIQESMDNNYIR